MELRKESEISLKTLIDMTDFRIEQITQDGNNFGNQLVVVKSDEQSIRFISEKGQTWCDIDVQGEWYFCEDVFSVLGIQWNKTSNGFTCLLKDVSQVILTNLQKFSKLSETDKIEEITRQLKEISKARATQIFGSVVAQNPLL